MRNENIMIPVQSNLNWYHIVWPGCPYIDNYRGRMESPISGGYIYTRSPYGLIFRVL